MVAPLVVAPPVVAPPVAPPLLVPALLVAGVTAFVVVFAAVVAAGVVATVAVWVAADVALESGEAASALVAPNGPEQRAMAVSASTAAEASRAASLDGAS